MSFGEDSGEDVVFGDEETDEIEKRVDDLESKIDVNVRSSKDGSWLIVETIRREFFHKNYLTEVMKPEDEE